MNDQESVGVVVDQESGRFPGVALIREREQVDEWFKGSSVSWKRSVCEMMSRTGTSLSRLQQGT